MAAINFFSQDISFSLPNPRKTSAWIKKALEAERRSLNELNFIFCSDDYLLAINRQYLKHNTYTDIITFNNSDERKVIEGDIFISIDRVEENARKLNLPFNQEIRRVIIHGILHLVGYTDKEEAKIRQMRKKEDTYLSLW
jgi:probable rRNA maturation factor